MRTIAAALAAVVVLAAAGCAERFDAEGPTAHDAAGTFAVAACDGDLEQAFAAAHVDDERREVAEARDVPVGPDGLTDLVEPRLLAPQCAEVVEVDPEPSTFEVPGAEPVAMVVVTVELDDGAQRTVPVAVVEHDGRWWADPYSALLRLPGILDQG